MAEQQQVYKCTLCGNIVLVLHGGVGELVCCGQPMQLMTANTVDASREKHVPVIEIAGNTVTVKVGSVPHPMEEKHYIEWIEVTSGARTCRLFLKPGDAPQASFSGPGPVSARAYCNLHGLWQNV